MPNTKECSACPIAEVSRRVFLRDVALAAAATMVAVGLAPGTAFAETVRATAPLTVTLAERTYEIPPVDGVAIDTANEVILVRWHGSAYAFALACPHRGTSLEWHADEARVFAPSTRRASAPTARTTADDSPAISIGMTSAGRETRSSLSSARCAARMSIRPRGRARWCLWIDTLRRPSMHVADAWTPGGELCAPSVARITQ